MKLGEVDEVKLLILFELNSLLKDISVVEKDDRQLLLKMIDSC